MLLTQVSRGIHDLHHRTIRRKKANLLQYTRGAESSPSTIYAQVIITEAWFFPTNYRTLRVRKTTYRSLMYSKGDNYERLTWLGKATSNTFFIRIKISSFQVPRLSVILVTTLMSFDARLEK